MFFLPTFILDLIKKLKKQLLQKAKRIFTGMKHKNQPVLKRYCLSPYETAYVEMIPSSNHQTLWISTKFQG